MKKELELNEDLSKIDGAGDPAAQQGKPSKPPEMLPVPPGPGDPQDDSTQQTGVGGGLSDPNVD